MVNVTGMPIQVNLKERYCFRRLCAVMRRYVYCDVEKGGQIAVAEAARNIVCSGGEPLAVTDCLNFGNPYNPEIYWQFVQAIKGLGEGCRRFNTRLTGGNGFIIKPLFMAKSKPYTRLLL